MSLSIADRHGISKTMLKRVINIPQTNSIEGGSKTCGCAYSSVRVSYRDKM